MEKTYELIWEERMSAIVTAKNKKEAKELVVSGEICPETAELISDIKICKMD